MNTSDSTEIFERFAPPASVEYCDRIYHRLDFELKIKKERKSKYADYSYNRRADKHTITINDDLNPFHFLISYLHEVAHLITHKAHGSQVAPHGKEWQACFRQMLSPVMHPSVFPQDVLRALRSHMALPRAATCTDPMLIEVLKKYDRNWSGTLLKELKNGERFAFNGKTYLKIKKRRTRSLCEREGTAKKYLIAETASVHKIESDGEALASHAGNG